MAQDPSSPLKDLYQDKNDMPVLSYPHDLGTTRKGHFITFSVLIPTKSTYKASAGSFSSATAGVTNSTLISAAQTSLNSAATTASQASSLASTVGSVATAANQALTTASQVAGVAASAVGIVSGVTGVVSSATAATSAATAVTGTVTGLVAGASALSSLASTVNSVPGVSSFLSDPVKSISNTFDSIKNFINSPDKSVSSPTPVSTSKAADIKFTPPVLKPKGYINLYMPDTVSMAQHAAYGDISKTEALGALGGAMEGYGEGKDFANAFGSIYDNFNVNDISGSTIKTYKDIQSGAIKVPPLALEGAGALLGKTGLVNNGGAVSKMLLKNAGYAINPQFEVFFTAMDFRKFQFDFTFTPKSAAEAATIREIIKLFRMHASPSNPNSGSGRYFVTPSIFQINYMFLESHNDNLHKFAPCVLETVIVDYAPEVGWVTFNDGMPVKTRMTLQFKETEVITQESIDKEGY